MNKDFIKIRRARVHNLKNVNLDIPQKKMVVVTGVSGSGKSSLVFDTLYAEGQRRYVESLSAYARQFLGIMPKPDADKIEGISPAISIDQRKPSHNPRSTVGTITEIYDYLRLLFARVGIPHCPKCKRVVSRQTIDQMVEQILKLPRRSKTNEIIILGPVVRGKKGEHQEILNDIQRSGFVRVRIDGRMYHLSEAVGLKLARYKIHNIDVVVDRLTMDKDLDKSRLVDSLEMALKLGKGVAIVSQTTNGTRSKKLRSFGEDIIFSEHLACERCGISLPEIEPRLFSFNSPYGACPACQGLGEKLVVDPKLVIPNTNLSIAEGAIFPWARASHRVGRQGFFWWQLKELSERKDIDLYTPVKNLSREKMDLVLYGGDGFEGVIPSLERRYRETDSEYTREEIKQYMVEKVCEKCQGKRLRAEALAVTITGKSIDDVVRMSIEKEKRFFESLLRSNLSKMKIAESIIKEILDRLQFLIDVGLDYLTLHRRAQTLAGGEGARIRLATQIGSTLTGVLYILDEPSVGLHARDQERLIKTLKRLRDLGNTVLVVEHDPQTIINADWVIDIGPGAGKKGGKIVFQGTPKQLLKAHTLTGDYLSGRKKVRIDRLGKSLNNNSKNKKNSKETRNKFLVIKGAQEHNLKNIDVKIPLEKFVCLTGVSGSGKSSLMNDILARALMKKFYPFTKNFSNGIYKSREEPGKYKTILGIEQLDKVVLVDQSPIGRTPRSNPVTYTGAYTYIREIFARTREARVRGYQVGRFSFNVKGGRCEACEGQGVKKIEMYFLPDVYVVCQECKGKRFNKETLSIEYKGKNIAEVLEMTVEEALEFFKNIPGLYSKLKTLNDVGLGYIELGQPAPSLSGGEAQRIKLAAELSKKSTGRTLYILDEPTTGLHPDDIKKLILILKKLVEKGNTVISIEHNIDFIKNADWIIDLGPEGGDRGGYIVTEGTLSDVSKNKKSYTGRYLKSVLG